MKKRVLISNNKIVKDFTDMAVNCGKLNNDYIVDVDSPIVDEYGFRELSIEEINNINSLLKKEERLKLVLNIEVTYNNVVYQGDEKSQDRMSRAINGLPDDTTIINWKAKDNSTQALTRLDLKEILFLAGQEQTKILFK